MATWQRQWVQASDPYATCLSSDAEMGNPLRYPVCDLSEQSDRGLFCPLDDIININIGPVYNLLSLEMDELAVHTDSSTATNSDEADFESENTATHTSSEMVSSLCKRLRNKSARALTANNHIPRVLVVLCPTSTMQTQQW